MLLRQPAVASEKEACEKWWMTRKKAEESLVYLLCMTAIMKYDVTRNMQWLKMR